MINFNKNKNILFLISSFLMIRIIIAYINTNFLILPGFADDARGNHVTASIFLLDSRSSESKLEDMHYYNFFYFYVIYYIYKFTFVSWFWSSLISCFCWFLSSIIFFYIFNLFKTHKNNILLFFIFYGLMPSTIVFSSSTFRESIEILILSLIILNLVLAYKKSYFFLLLTPIFLYIYSLFHIVNLYSSIFLIIILFYFKFFKYIIIFYKVFLFCLVIFSISIIYFLNSGHIIDFTNLFLQKIYRVLENFHIGSVTTAYTRASYMDIFEINNFTDFINFLILKISKYFLEPIIFVRKINFLDIILFLENIIRLVIILFFIFIFSKSDKKNNFFYLILFIFFIFIEVIWSLGTTNWGTAARHHFVPLQLLLFSTFAINSKNSVNFKRVL